MIASFLISLVMGGSADVIHEDASIPIDGKLLDAVFLDWDNDGRKDLCLAILPAARPARELHFHSFDESGGLRAAPDQIVEIKADVTTYGFADVRREPGKELVFLTGTGVFSYSLTRPGYRNNVRRLLRADLLYEVPNPDSLPRWEYVLEFDDGDRLLLPEGDGFSIWGPGPGAEPGSAYVRLLDSRASAMDTGASIAPGPAGGAARLEEDDSGASVEFTSTGIMVAFDSGGQSEFLIEEDEGQFGNLISYGRQSPSPALVHLNADGKQDLALRDEKGLHQLNAESLWQKSRSSLSAYPAYLSKVGNQKLRFQDLDGDGDSDLLVVASKENQGLGNSEQKILILRNDGRGLLPEKPTQVMQFLANDVTPRVADVDGDGRLDLIVQKFLMPSVLESVSDLSFTQSTLVFFGGGKGGPVFSRNPDLKEERSIGVDSIESALTRNFLQWDCSGDGIADLVQVGLDGKVSIRRVSKESSFFGGDRWELESSPWKRFDRSLGLIRIYVDDVNGDSLGDVVSMRANELIVFLSRQRN